MVNDKRSTLAQLLLAERPTVTGLYYNGQRVRLDGYTWEGCRFDNCTLEVTSDNFAIKNCIIDQSNTIEFSSGLLKVIKLFNIRFPWAYTHIPHQFLPLLNSASSITIQDAEHE